MQSDGVQRSDGATEERFIALGEQSALIPEDDLTKSRPLPIPSLCKINIVLENFALHVLYCLLLPV